MSYIVVDIESDDQSPATGSMVCFGAVLVNDSSKTFYGKTAPIVSTYNPEALAISGISREEHKTFDNPREVMQNFAEWIKNNSKGRPIFISDNPAYDWQFINFYFHYYLGQNPFGFSARRIGDLYCGMVKDGLKLAMQRGTNVVQGHYHTDFNIKYVGNPSNLLFSLQSGCLINTKALSFAYDKLNLSRPIIGTSVIINSKPELIPMVLNSRGRWVGKL